MKKHCDNYKDRILRENTLKSLNAFNRILRVIADTEFISQNRDLPEYDKQYTYDKALGYDSIKQVIFEEFPNYKQTFEEEIE